MPSAWHVGLHPVLQLYGIHTSSMRCAMPLQSRLWQQGKELSGGIKPHWNHFGKGLSL